MEMRNYYYFVAIYNYLSCIGMFVRRGIYTVCYRGAQVDEPKPFDNYSVACKNSCSYHHHHHHISL